MMTGKAAGGIAVVIGSCVLTAITAGAALPVLIGVGIAGTIGSVGIGLTMFNLRDQNVGKEIAGNGKFADVNSYSHMPRAAENIGTLCWCRSYYRTKAAKKLVSEIDVLFRQAWENRNPIGQAVPTKYTTLFCMIESTLKLQQCTP